MDIEPGNLRLCIDASDKRSWNGNGTLADVSGWNPAGFSTANQGGGGNIQFSGEIDSQTTNSYFHSSGMGYFLANQVESWYFDFGANTSEVSVAAFLYKPAASQTVNTQIYTFTNDFNSGTDVTDSLFLIQRAYSNGFAGQNRFGYIVQQRNPSNTATEQLVIGTAGPQMTVAGNYIVQLGARTEPTVGGYNGNVNGTQFGADFDATWGFRAVANNSNLATIGRRRNTTAHGLPPNVKLYALAVWNKRLAPEKMSALYDRLRAKYGV